MATQHEVLAGLGKSIELLGVLNEQLTLPEVFPAQFARLTEEDAQRLADWLTEFNDRLLFLVTVIQADLRAAAEQRRTLPPPSAN